MKPLWKVKGSFDRTSWKVSDVRVVREIWVLSSFSVFSLSLSLCLSLCVCLSLSLVVVVVVVVEGEEEEEGGGKEKERETDRTIWTKVSLKIAGTEQFYQVKRMIGGIGDMLFSICSQT